MYHHHCVARKSPHMVAEPSCGSTEPSIQEQAYSLLQQSSFVGPELSTHLARSEVSTMIRRLATQEHYVVLAQLVSLISAILKFGAGTCENPFMRVNTLITELISWLQDGASSESRQKACFDEETSKASAKEDLEADAAKHSSILETTVSRVTLDGEVSSQDRISQCTVEQTLDVPVPEMVESPKIASQDRVQQHFGGQTVETPAVSLAEKIIEMPVTHIREETKQVVNTHVQHAVNAVEAEKPIINEKINQVTKHVEIPQLQIVEKTAKTPETQITQGTQTSESMGNATARLVVDIEAHLPAESASPMFVSKPVSETPVVQYMANACEVRDSSAYRCSSGPSDHNDSGADSLPSYSANRHWDSVEETPVAQQSLLPTAQTAQKTEEIPHVRHIDKVVGVPVVDQRQTPTIKTEQKMKYVPQIQCLEPLVDVPVVTQ